MTIMKTWEWKPTKQTVLRIRLANELWFSELPDGGKFTDLFHLGWYENEQYPEVRIYSLSLLWLTIQLGL